MNDILHEARQCTICAPALKHGVNPVLSAAVNSKIVIIGQAPGSNVHASGIPWDDKSGDRLRSWLGVSKQSFYNPQNFAILPMGFCYPGKGTTGDLPPRKECAPKWHEVILSEMRDVRLTLLIGAYAQEYYLKDRMKKTLTETVKNYKSYLPDYIVLPHPSPRNNIWMKKNPWFQQDLMPHLIDLVSKVGMIEE